MPSHRAHPAQRTTTPRSAARHRGVRLLLALLLALSGVLALPTTAYAEDPGELAVTKTVDDWEDGQEVTPNEPFVYTIQVGCTNLGSGGCTSATLTDPLPDGLILDGDASDILITPAGSGTATVDGNTVNVTFTQPLTDPAGGQGIQDSTTITIQVPVRVDPDISATQNGQALTNTATADGTNTEPDSDDFTVVPNVPVELAATTDKSFSPDRATASPGTETTMTLTGGNASNLPVDEITMTDPANPPGAAFDSLALTGDLDVDLPAGAEQVQVDVWVNGAWVNGPPGPPPATLPDGVDPAAVQGIRIHFLSTDDEGIAPGVEGSVDVGLEQRDGISVGTITNEVTTTVTDPDGDESDPVTADDDYVVTTGELPLDASKTFDPDTIAVGGQSRVVLGATNTSDQTLDTLSITEPGGDPNMFENGLSFTGWSSGIVWPEGATGATVTYTYADGSSEELTAGAPNTLPDPSAGQEVVGFTVEFTGDIAAGAEATVPFTVTAAEEQAAEEVEHPNTITANSSAPGGFTGNAEADDTLTTIQDRLAVDVSKEVSPSEILSVPGEIATVQLTGTLQEFPASTTDANQIVVQDPADPGNSPWWDAFAPDAVVATPIPDGATLTVQYYDGTTWVDVPGMVDLAGPQIFSGDFPPEVVANAQGIRFVYDSDEGFPPGTTVAPNLNFSLLPEMADSDLDDIENCAGSGANNSGGVEADDAVQTPPDCPTIDLTPPTPGTGDLIDKDWDNPKAVGERSGSQLGATLSWSTGGRSNLDSEIVADISNPTAANLPDSVFDSFDLVRIDAISAAQDPLLTYDRVARVELYRLGANAWQVAPGDPCPARCDGTFPGYTIPTDIRADVIGFRLVFEESPTRSARIGNNPTAPPVGSGVARSFSNDRHIHPVFQIRDELRSDPGVPVVSEAVYNVSDEAGQVRNTVRADGLVDGDVVVSDTASDIVTITNVPVTVTLAKTWSGGPLGVPEPGTATFPEQYPTGRMTLDAHNTTPRKIDRLTITEPDPTSDADPFDTFNLQDFVSITDPATIGASDVVITLNPNGPNTRTLTRTEALGATEAQLSDVVGYTVVYTGRINAGAHAVVTTDTRLRQTSRSTGNQITAADGPIGNQASTLAEDLVDYPGVTPDTAADDDTADIALATRGIGLEVTKTFSPDSQTEPDRDPVTVTLTGRPSGPSRTNWMQIVDEDATFFNQYDFVGFGSFSFTAPINQVQVDALVGGTFTVDGDTVVNDGATWVTGVPGTTLSLPAGVTPAQVQGLRFTFTRADGLLWENPANPLQQIPLQVQRRLELHTGGPVQSDLAGNTAAPGEANPGEASDTIQGRNQGADLVGGQPISATDDATDTILYRHAVNAVTVDKSPDGAQQPGVNIPYTLTFTNTGDVAIFNPVITDQLPSDDDGPLLVFDPNREGPGTGYTFALTGAAPDPVSGSAMPTDPAQIEIDESATEIRFTFPAGTVLEEGQTYTITLPLQFRTGLEGNTPVTNTTGIRGDRPWDECEATLADNGECQASSTVYPTRAGALRGVKTVRANDDELGVLNTRGAASCDADTDGFYAGGCVPVTKPGGDETWRLTFTNTGNLPQDRVYAIDRLPVPGDTGAITSLTRGSQWRPIPKELRYVNASQGGVSAIRVFYTTSTTLCTNELLANGTCPPGAWTQIGSQINNPEAGAVVAQIPENAAAIKIETDFATRLFNPTGQLRFDLVTTTPAQSPTAGADTIAWNTVAVAARNRDGGSSSVTPRTEGNKVGVALATGPIAVQKVVDGPAAEYAPDSFELTVRCTSVGETVDLGARGTITVTPGAEPTRVDNIPWGSECTVTEDLATAGSPEFEATTVTVVRDDQTVPIVIATNTYQWASLQLAKDVTGSALDSDGNPLAYGPFTFTVACTYLGAPVYADGYSADNPMVITIASDTTDPPPLTQLPAGASCTATETDTAGAEQTTSSGTNGTDTVTGDSTISLVLTPDGTDPQVTNTVTFTNTFATGAVTITKVRTGAGADDYGDGPFTVHLRCTDAEDADRVVYDGDVTLNAGNTYTDTVDDLYVDASCQVAETDDGGATTSSVSPAGPFTVTAASDADPVEVTVTNEFDLASLQLAKDVAGSALDAAGQPISYGPFEFTVTCSFQGEPVYATGYSAENPMIVSVDDDVDDPEPLTGLPAGADCTATETGDGGAASTSVTANGGERVDANTIALVLTPDGEDPVVTNTVTFTNTFVTGQVRIEKTITGNGAEQYGDGPFTVHLTCLSTNEDEEGTPAAGTTIYDGDLVLGQDNGYAVTVDDLYVDSSCQVTETVDGGATSSSVSPEGSFPVTADSADDPVDVTVTNEFDLASLQLAKDISDSALDADGNPVAYGPFEFTVECTFEDEPVYAAGYSADNPMVITVASDTVDPEPLTGLPAGADCTATETDTDDAESTTVRNGDGDPADGATIDLTLTPDGEEAAVTNTVTFTNTFATGALTITKEITGDGADDYGAGPFTVHVTCTAEGAPDGTVWDGDRELTAANGYSVTITDLYVPSSCQVTEMATGGATSSTVSPAGAFDVTADSAETPVVVTVTNRFDVGSLRLIKKIDGDVSSDTEFTFEVSCQQLINGEVVPLDMGDAGEVTLSEADGLTAQLDGLPSGAVCTVSEIEDGGADATTIDPGEVTIGDGTVVDVLAVNTFEPPPDNGGSSGGHDLANTGGPSLIFLGVGVLLLIAGGTLLAARRRRG